MDHKEYGYVKREHDHMLLDLVLATEDSEEPLQALTFFVGGKVLSFPVDEVALIEMDVACLNPSLCEMIVEDSKLSASRAA